MKRRKFIALAGAAAAFPRTALAQQAANVPRIVVLSNSMPDDRRQAIFDGLADFGYVDRKNIAVEFLTAPTIGDVPGYAARAVAGNPDLILTLQSAPPLAVKSLTSTIPVVMAGLQDPVAIGAAASYARPGGNLTGYMNGGPDIAGKQIGLIREVLPSLSRIATIGLPDDPVYPVVMAQLLTATAAFGIEPIRFDSKEGDDFVALFERVAISRAQAVLVTTGNYLKSLPVSARLADLALGHKLPTFSTTSGNARDGCLLGYSSNGLDTTRRSVAYVDAILKGARPADLPIVQPSVFELAVNVRTAKALGITIPQSILYQATEIIS